MDNEELHRQLLQRMTRMETLLESGFDGVHKRQDLANGKMKRNERHIRELQDWKLQIMSKVSVIAVLVSGLVSVLFLVFNKYI